mmetsp:Transcript_26982/g.85550  ORF Transcript_26982/g.85550 Transcript_26982/m.85550 type:complete len:202 (-) Transcript_26982:1403-2008(-)
MLCSRFHSTHRASPLPGYSEGSSWSTIRSTLQSRSSSTPSRLLTSRRAIRAQARLPQGPHGSTRQQRRAVAWQGVRPPRHRRRRLPRIQLACSPHRQRPSLPRCFLGGLPLATPTWTSTSSSCVRADWPAAPPTPSAALLPSKPTRPRGPLARARGILPFSGRSLSAHAFCTRIQARHSRQHPRAQRCGDAMCGPTRQKPR